MPFLSYVLISWIVFYEFKKFLDAKFANNIFSSIFSYLLTLAIMTIPLMYFFGGILYVEMPMILFMLIVILDINAFITVDYKSLMQRPSWYAFLMIGFIKESAVIIIIPILLSRFFYRNIYIPLFKSRHSVKAYKSNKHIKTEKLVAFIKKLFKQELVMYILTILPIAIYLFFRLFFGDPRPYGFEAYNFLNALSYWFFVNGILFQFGIILIFSLIGLFISLRNKEGRTFLFFILFVAVFFICDIYIYIGYSRWNLFIAPIIIVSFIRFIECLLKDISTRQTGRKRIKSKDLISHKASYLIIIIIVILIGNLVLMPLGFDGARKNWGCTNCPDTDRTYPYMNALSQFKNQNIRNLYVTGYDIPNEPEIGFYTEKYNITTNLVISRFVLSSDNMPDDVSDEKKLIDYIIFRISPESAFRMPFSNEDVILYVSQDNTPDAIFDGLNYEKFSNTAYYIYVIRHKN